MCDIQYFGNTEYYMASILGYMAIHRSLQYYMGSILGVNGHATFTITYLFSIYFSEGINHKTGSR